ncbi:MAG: hypothetical protein HYX72_07355 [Acidobacteria bacterium]|nr:hypothetical protein [Acidobacteriota bacterium]
MISKQAAKVFGFMLAVALWASPASAQVAGGIHSAAITADQPTTISPTNVDLHSLKAQIDAFQNVLNRTIQQKFGHPFSLLQDAKGIYLAGFGVAFHMEVNLHPLRMMSPFDLRPYTPEEIRKSKEEKIARIAQLRTELADLLMRHGGQLNAMAPEQNIAVAVHLFNLRPEGPDLPSQLVMKVDRQMLLDFQTRRLTAEQFQKAASVLEF